ncbi:MAG: response regulator [Bacteroidota bacterium]
MEAEKKLKILMLEDNPEDAFLIERVLRKDNMVFVSERVDTREEFCESIERFQPDVVLSDHGLPRFNSREALKISLKERATAPFILVTGTMSDEIAISCLAKGPTTTSERKSFAPAFCHSSRYQRTSTRETKKRSALCIAFAKP